MSELTVGILGFVCIIAIVITLFKSKTMPSMAFIIFPSILGLILVLGGYYTIGEIGPARPQPCLCSLSCSSES